MWFISHTTTGENVYFLAEKLRYTVGRMGADIELQDDICVSRAHAAFNLVKTNDCLNLEIEDLGSKYGTYLNKGIETNTPVEKSRKISLKSNDLIRFGRLQNIWKVQFMVIDTATSSLSKDDSQQLKSYIEALGGKISEQWSSNCTHLTMSEPSITMKLLHALIDQKMVVTPAYWKDLLKSMKSIKAKLPKPELYTPASGDELIDFNYNIKRRTLFKGITFVFLNRKHFDMYSPIVKSAGGACKDLNSGVQKAFLIKERVVVVQYTPSTQTQSSQTISTIAEFLESNSKRIIPEYEIGLAILHCSIEKFCNPDFKMTQTMAMSSQIDLTDDQSRQSQNTDSIDLEIPETNENLITSTPYVNPDNININSKGETMPQMRITETPGENERKRKNISGDLEGSDDDLFQFQPKRACNENENNEKENEKSDQITVERENETTVEKISTINVFLQKTQNRDKTQTSSQQFEDEPSSSKENRKRPLIQVLNEDDEGDDDLFRFGDTQKTKKVRTQSGDDEDLFSFKEKEANKSKRPLRTIDLDEDSNDMEPTQQFIVVEKVIKKPKIQMPKPKSLPRKISAIDWISSSLGKINIKKEITNDLITNENDNIKTEAEIKTENPDDINITEDHRKWLESLKNAIEIQQVSINTSKHGEKSHYIFKNRSNIQSENSNEIVPNFKKFVKKYHVPIHNNSTGIKLHLR